MKRYSKSMENVFFNVWELGTLGKRYRAKEKHQRQHYRKVTANDNGILASSKVRKNCSWQWSDNRISIKDKSLINLWMQWSFRFY